jgi:hypothetical protein
MLRAMSSAWWFLVLPLVPVAIGAAYIGWKERDWRDAGREYEKLLGALTRSPHDAALRSAVLEAGCRYYGALDFGLTHAPVMVDADICARTGAFGVVRATESRPRPAVARQG